MYYKVLGFCQEGSWNGLSVCVRQLEYFLKHRLKISRYYFEIESSLKESGLINNDRCQLSSLIKLISQLSFVDKLNTDIQKVRKTTSIIKTALIVWKMEYMSQEKIQEVVQAFCQFSREGPVRLTLNSINCLLRNARLVISKEAFELWCEKCVGLLKKQEIISLDEFLYLAPNGVEIEDYVRKLAKRRQSRGLVAMCISAESNTPNLIKNLSQDLKNKTLIYVGVETSRKELALRQKYKQAMESRNLQPAVVRTLLTKMCHNDVTYNVKREDHQTNLLNGVYIRENINEELRTGKALLIEKEEEKQQTQPELHKANTCHQRMSMHTNTTKGQFQRKQVYSFKRKSHLKRHSLVTNIIKSEIRQLQLGLYSDG